MGSGATAKYALPYPLGTDPPNVPGDVQALAAAVDAILAPYQQDLVANRPAPGKTGRTFTESATSTGLPGTTWRDDGTAWRALGSRIVAQSAGDTAQIIRGFLGQTADLTSWQDSTGGGAAHMTVAGELFAGAVYAGGGYLGATMSATTKTATTPAIIARSGFIGQSGTLQEWQTQSGTPQASVGYNGAITAGIVGATHAFTGFLNVSGQVFSQPTGISQIPHIVRLFSGQTVNMTEWQNTSATALSAVKNDGKMFMPYGSVGGDIRYGASSTAMFSILSSAAGNEALALRAASGQSADILRITNNAASKLFGVDPVGRVLINPSLTTNATLVDSGLSVTPRASTGLAAMIMGASGQVGNLLDFRDSGNNVLASVLPDGSLGPVRTFAGSDTRRLNIGSFGLLQDRNIGGDTTSADSYKTVLAHNAYITTQSTNTWTQPNDYANKWRMEMGARGVKTGFRASSGGTHETWTDTGWTDIFTLSMDNPTALIKSPAIGNTPLTLQGASGQTAALLSLVAGGGATVTGFDANGALNPVPAVFVNTGYLNARLSAAPTSTGESAIVARAFSGQTVDIQQWQSSGGTLLTSVNSSGQLFSNQGVWLSSSAFLVAGNNTWDSFGGRIGAVPNSTTQSGVVIRGLASQSADLLVAQNSTPARIAGITSTGNVQGTGAYTTLSDKSVKMNVRDLLHDPLDVVRRLRPVHFDYIGGNSDQVGFVAQEVEPVLPSAVSSWDTLYGGIPDREGRLGLQTDAILAYAIGALQNIDRRLAALERVA